MNPFQSFFKQMLNICWFQLRFRFWTVGWMNTAVCRFHLRVFFTVL